MMQGALRDLRKWWRWRVRRIRLHILGIVEFRMLGTVVGLDSGRWVIDGEDGRPVHVESEHPSAVGIQIGDHVEVEPRSPSSIGGPFAGEYWIIVRKLKAECQSHCECERGEPKTDA